MVFTPENNSIIDLAQSMLRETRLSVQQCAQKLSKYCLSSSPLANPLSSAGETIVINTLGPPKATPIVITTLANCSTMFILSGGLHPRLYYMPIVKPIAQKIGSHADPISSDALRLGGLASLVEHGLENMKAIKIC